MTENKYKMFRNYMTNELGVTRGDIEAWTKESVAAEVGKLIGQMNLPDMVNRSLNIAVQSAIKNRFSEQPTEPMKKAMVVALSEILAGKIEISIKSETQS